MVRNVRILAPNKNEMKMKNLGIEVKTETKINNRKENGLINWWPPIWLLMKDTFVTFEQTTKRIDVLDIYSGAGGGTAFDLKVRLKL